MPEPQTIRVAIAEGSTILQRALAAAFQAPCPVEVVGTTGDGNGVLELVQKCAPEVLLLGFGLNRRDVWEVLPELMARQPLPTIVLCPADGTTAVEDRERLANFGAVGTIRKPPLGVALDKSAELRAELLPMIQRAARVKVVRLIPKSEGPSITPLPLKNATPLPVRPSAVDVPAMRPSTPGPPAHRVIVIGSSTGGPSALAEILKQLDRHFAAPIVIAQHMPDGLIPDLVRYLRSECAIGIEEARDGERVQPGRAYLCPGRSHIRMKKGGIIALEPCGNKLEHSPSVDILFRSAADAYGEGTYAVVLTGMGNDGADGVRAVKSRGGRAIAQDERTCVVYGMPKEAAATGVLDAVVPVQNIATFMIGFAGARPR